MFSGLARAYAVTGSKPTQEKVHRLVRRFRGKPWKPTGKFYVDLPVAGLYLRQKPAVGLIDGPMEFAGGSHRDGCC